MGIGRQSSVRCLDQTSYQTCDFFFSPFKPLPIRQMSSTTASASSYLKAPFIPQQIVIYALLFVLGASSLTILLIVIICYSALVLILGTGAVK